MSETRDYGMQGSRSDREIEVILAENVDLRQEIDRLGDDCERERMRLAACGVVAISDTPESAKQARDMHSDYRSASCDDVARRVDECMRLRAENERLAAEGQRVLDKMNAYKADCDTLRGQNERPRDDMVAIQWKASILRELVREVADLDPWAAVPPDWYERAEKALGD